MNMNRPSWANVGDWPRIKEAVEEYWGHPGKYEFLGKADLAFILEYDGDEDDGFPLYEGGPYYFMFEGHHGFKARHYVEDTQGFIHRITAAEYEEAAQLLDMEEEE